MKATHKIMIIGLVLLFAGAALAFAHGGRNGGGGYGDCPGYGMGPGAMYGDGYGMGPGMMNGKGGGGYGADLTQEQRDKLEASREQFFKQTEELRTQIRDQRLALHDELNNQNPDADKVAQLQKEVSKLQSEFDQKAVQHKLEMRQIAPDHFRGYGKAPGGNGRNGR